MSLSMQELEISVLGRCRIDSPVRKILGAEALQRTGHADKILVDNRLSSVVAYAERGEPMAELPAFELAGPRDKIYFDPSKTRAAIVTCGGICPGLNNVIRGIVLELYQAYGVRKVYGFCYGYAGFIASHGHDVMDLTPSVVRDIHHAGGTILSSSRGPQDPEAIVDCLDRMGINVLFVIGGDGTMRGAMSIVKEVQTRNLKISVIGVPKTIDNDIPFIERSFGFETSYTEAGRCISAARAEARGCLNGIGLVKVMGRHSGFIACNSALAQTDANFVLIPEVHFDLEGRGGLMDCLERKLAENGHLVVVLAEGAGQDLMKEEPESYDASGNVRLQDIGAFLREKIQAYFKKKDVPVNIKYIDPSYIIRSVAASSSDSVYCWSLARNAVHAAMSGNTEMVIGHWQGHFVHVPMALATSGRKVVDTNSGLWRSVIEATGQPARMVATV